MEIINTPSGRVARKALEINELDTKALAYLAAHPGARPTDLCPHLGVTAAGVTTLVDRLIQRGILRRELDERDRRVNHIYVVVDLNKEPWSQLTRFDDTCRELVIELDPQVEADLAALFTHTTVAARKDAARARGEATA